MARGFHAPPNLFRARYASLRFGVAANALVGEKLALARKRVPAQHAFERDARGDVFVHGQVSDYSRARFSAEALAGGAVRQQAVPAPQVGRVRGDPQRPQIRVFALREAHRVPRDVPARAAQHVRARVRREGDGRAEALRVRATQETFRRVRRAGTRRSSRRSLRRMNDIVHVASGFRNGRGTRNSELGPHRRGEPTQTGRAAVPSLARVSASERRNAVRLFPRVVRRHLGDGEPAREIPDVGVGVGFRRSVRAFGFFVGFFF